jgi:hypothetical protein
MQIHLTRSYVGSENLKVIAHGYSTSESGEPVMPVRGTYMVENATQYVIKLGKRVTPKKRHAFPVVSIIGADVNTGEIRMNFNRHTKELYRTL